MGKLHLVDLAGSERIAKGAASAERAKEAQAIHKSLTALGDVLQVCPIMLLHLCHPRVPDVHSCVDVSSNGLAILCSLGSADILVCRTV